MKLASCNLPHSRDGELYLVSRDLVHAVSVKHYAPTLQYALDHWDQLSPVLFRLYDELNALQTKDTVLFSELNWLAPLPRAYQWADGSAYVNHVELVRKARGAELPPEFWHDPLMYQGGSDSFLSATDEILLQDDAFGLDFESEVAVITGDVPMGVLPEHATDCIRLFMLVNDVSLRNLIPKELAKGFGFFHSKPSSSCSPVAVTVDEFASAWDGHTIHLPLRTDLNGNMFGCPNVAADMTFDFPTLISHAAFTRKLSAGTIIGSGTVSNYDKTKGSSCIAERRMLEQLEFGAPRTPFLKHNDHVRIEMFNEHQHSIFGAISQFVRHVKQDAT